jgi:GMP synthase (glutamine-hydrolysing)
VRVHYIQHVPFEDLGCIEPILIKREHELVRTQMYLGEPLPIIKEIDWLQARPVLIRVLFQL